MSNLTSRPARIVLTGFSGSGKSAVASVVARELRWDVADTDEMIQKTAGKSILEIFRDHGENAFRDLEVAAIREACSRERVVVSAGGGAVLRAENRRAMADGGFVMCLEARAETILRRLTAGGRALDRPLLATEDPLSRIRELKASRQHLYALCDWSVQTDSLTPKEVASEVLRAFNEVGEAVLSDPARLEALAAAGVEAPPGTLHAIPEGVASIVSAGGGEYPVVVGWGLLNTLGQRLRDHGLARQAFVVSDEAVFHHAGDELEEALRAAEVSFETYLVPPGEGSKSLETASQVYDWLIQQKAERGHTVVALGGGMVTDLAGYVAATFARGLPLVYVPTSLLGMVDAAIGGKVGVNHPRAKNMIGAFYQPRMVLADVATLRTLSPREYFSGWAEVIKHGIIADEGLLAFLEENAERVLKLEPDATTEAVRRSVAIKSRIVSEDEREETGLRTTLNYGHTLAHAIESATGYTRFLHGEAVAIGMMAAAGISARMGPLTPVAVERQRRVLELYRLPVEAKGIDRARIDAAMAVDKKVRGKRVQWVLLEGIGRPVLRDDVPSEVVEEALGEVLA
jgi:shikimate kinase / 3-dehydroquinate synthase